MTSFLLFPQVWTEPHRSPVWLAPPPCPNHGGSAPGGLPVAGEVGLKYEEAEELLRSPAGSWLHGAVTERALRLLQSSGLSGLEGQGEAVACRGVCVCVSGTFCGLCFCADGKSWMGFSSRCSHGSCGLTCLRLLPASCREILPVFLLPPLLCRALKISRPPPCRGLRDPHRRRLQLQAAGVGGAAAGLRAPARWHHARRDPLCPAAAGHAPLPWQWW